MTPFDYFARWLFILGGALVAIYWVVRWAVFAALTEFAQRNIQ